MDGDASGVDDKVPCPDWTKCPHRKCVGETYTKESYTCDVCKESWDIYYDELQ